MNDEKTHNTVTFDLEMTAFGAEQLLAELATPEARQRTLNDPHYTIGQLTYYLKRFVEYTKAAQDAN